MWKATQPAQPEQASPKQDKHRKVFEKPELTIDMRMGNNRFSHGKKALLKAIRNIPMGDVLFVPSTEFSVKTVRAYVAEFQKKFPDYWLTTRVCDGGVEVIHKLDPSLKKIF